ncbi:unnamed protein product [Absidia cylindrospora]
MAQRGTQIFPLVEVTLKSNTVVICLSVVLLVLLSLLVSPPFAPTDFIKSPEATSKRSKELARENLWSRIHLVPLLTAEADRDLYRRTEAAKAREFEIMKDVPGWKAGESVYNNTKYYNAPSYVIVPEQQKLE